MSDPSSLTIAELQAEITKRFEAEKIKREANEQAMRDLALEHIGALLALQPHTRTSCSDESPSNGMGTYSWGGARCDCCALLEIKDSGYWPKEFSMKLDLPPVRRL